MSNAVFDQIVLRYQRRLQRYCMRFVSYNLAEEVVQETFLAAYHELESGKEIENLEAWLYQVARNKALNVLERERRRSHLSVDDLTEAGSAVLGSRDKLESHAETEQLFHDLGELPERQRSALLLSALGGFSHDDIAGELGTSAGSVRQLIARARTRLREGIAGLLPLPLARRWHQLSDFALQVHVRAVEATAFTKVVPVLAVAAAGVTVQQVVTAHPVSPIPVSAAVGDERTAQVSRNTERASWLNGAEPKQKRQTKHQAKKQKDHRDLKKARHHRDSKKRPADSVRKRQEQGRRSSQSHSTTPSAPDPPEGDSTPSETPSGGNEDDFDTRPPSGPPSEEPDVPSEAPFDP